MTDHPPQQGYPSAPQSPQPSAYPAPPPLIRRGIVACRPVDILPPSLHQLGRRANRHDMRRTDVQASEPRTDTHRRRSRSQLGTDLPARNAPIPRSPLLSSIRLGRHGSDRLLLPDRNPHHHLAPDLSPPLLPEYCRWTEGRERTGHGVLRGTVGTSTPPPTGISHTPNLVTIHRTLREYPYRLARRRHDGNSGAHASVFPRLGSHHRSRTPGEAQAKARRARRR